MTDLSPAAQAIWVAYLDHSEIDETPADLPALAAALEALADQSEAVHIVTGAGLSEFDVVLRVSNIHAIAAELNRTNPIEPKN
ncbi:MAG: hypothetical protein ACO3X1_13895 [Burkholderiaceae bacterium]